MSVHTALTNRCRLIRAQLLEVGSAVKIEGDHDAIDQMVTEVDLYCQLAMQDKPIFTLEGQEFVSQMLDEIVECIKDITKRNRLVRH